VNRVRTPFSPVRERERQRDRERKREITRERERERKREIKRERERGSERELLFLFLQRMTGDSAPFSYLVVIYL
jgi:hypothetical protein